MRLLIFLSIVCLGFFGNVQARTVAHTEMLAACELIGNKLSSVSVQECLDLQLAGSGAYTKQGHAIL